MRRGRGRRGEVRGGGGRRWNELELCSMELEDTWSE